ncbi:MAG: glycosyltransferase family 4 protein [Planctomycetota bacterium]|jgi:glycosyltransferase involved in cell wall biosynthesis
MKILYYSAHPDLSTRDAAGYATHMTELMGALRALGHTVEALVAGDARAGQGGRETGAAPDPAPRRLLRRLVPSPLWQALRDLRVRRHDRRSGRRLRELAARERPDVVYERAAYLCRSGVRVARARSIPLLLEMNAPYRLERSSLGGRSLLSWMGRGWERAVLRGAARVLAVSSPLRDHLAESHGLPPDRFRVVPNAVDPAAFDPGRAEPGGRAALRGTRSTAWSRPWPVSARRTSTSTPC